MVDLIEIVAGGVILAVCAQLERPLLGLVLLSFLIAIAACAQLAGPPVDPSTFPCGARGHQCPGRLCCSDGWDCGGTGEFPGCPAGQCCYEGPEMGAKRQPAVPPEAFDGGT